MHLYLQHQGPLLPFTPETLAFHIEDLICLHTTVSSPFHTRNPFCLSHQGSISLSHKELLLPFTPESLFPVTPGTPSAFYTRFPISCYTRDPFCLSQHKLLPFTSRTLFPFDTRTPFAFYTRVPISLSHQGPLLPFTSAAPPAFRMYIYHGCNQLMQTTLSETANCQYVFSQQDWVSAINNVCADLVHSQVLPHLNCSWFLNKYTVFVS